MEENSGPGTAEETDGGDYAFWSRDSAEENSGRRELGFASTAKLETEETDGDTAEAAKKDKIVGADGRKAVQRTKWGRHDWRVWQDCRARSAERRRASAPVAGSSGASSILTSSIWRREQEKEEEEEEAFRRRSENVYVGGVDAAVAAADGAMTRESAVEIEVRWKSASQYGGSIFIVS